jgi:hypothetical protein
MSALAWEETGALQQPEPEPSRPVALAVAPQPVSSGTYALYHTPQGGIHLVYRPVGAAEDQHLDVPPFVIKMASKAAGGGDLGPLGALLLPGEG